MSDRTLAIIKPDSVEKKFIGDIIKMISQDGFEILDMRMVKLSRQEAAKFYEVHKERPFFNDLLDYMTSGPVVPLALKKENAVAEFRRLIGATDPTQADEGTIRKNFGESKEKNAVHGSDSDDNAAIETAFFFPQREITLINS